MSRLAALGPRGYRRLAGRLVGLSKHAKTGFRG